VVCLLQFYGDKIVLVSVAIRCTVCAHAYLSL